MSEDSWLREHGTDLVQVPLIDLLTVVARMEQVAREGLPPGDLTHERIWTCDLPRLRAHLPSEALRELG